MWGHTHVQMRRCIKVTAIDGSWNAGVYNVCFNVCLARRSGTANGRAGMFPAAFVTTDEQGETLTHSRDVTTGLRQSIVSTGLGLGRPSMTRTKRQSSSV